MTIAFVQTAALASTGNGNLAQTSAFGANPTVGNYLAAWAWGWSSSTNGSSTFTFTDTNGGNTWATVGTQFITNDLWCCLGWAKVAATSASLKVTMTTAGGTPAGAVVCVSSEFSGILSASPSDGAAVGTAPGTTATSFPPGSKTLTSGSLSYGVMVNDDGGAASAVNGVTSGQPGTAPTGYTAVGTVYSGTIEVGQAFYAINPTSPCNPTCSTSDAATKWGATQFALKTAAAAAQGLIFVPFPGGEMIRTF